MAVPVVVRADEVALDGWDDLTRGRVMWHTLLCGDRVSTNSLVCGIAYFPPHGSLAPHSHAQAELYYGLDGEATVRLGDRMVALTRGATLFVPGGMVHGVEAGACGLTVLYVFAADRFSDVVYRFVDAAAPPGGG